MKDRRSNVVPTIAHISPTSQASIFLDKSLKLRADSDIYRAEILPNLNKSVALPIRLYMKKDKIPLSPFMSAERKSEIQRQLIHSGDQDRRNQKKSASKSYSTDHQTKSSRQPNTKKKGLDVIEEIVRKKKLVAVSKFSRDLHLTNAQRTLALKRDNCNKNNPSNDRGHSAEHNMETSMLSTVQISRDTSMILRRSCQDTMALTLPSPIAPSPISMNKLKLRAGGSRLLAKKSPISIHSLNHNSIFSIFNGWLPINLRNRQPIKAFFGQGNNISKISSIIRKRCKLDIVPNPSLANFVWTQLHCRSIKITNKFHFEKLAKVDFVNNLGYSIDRVEDLCSKLVGTGLFTVSDASMANRCFERLTQRDSIYSISSDALVLHSHLTGVYHISRKYNLAKTVINYCTSANVDPWSVMPQTFFIKTDTFASDLLSLVEETSRLQDVCLSESKWQRGQDYVVPMIIKPGECSNRGNGISIAYCEKDLKLICTDMFAGKLKPTKGVIQAYMVNPLLYRDRKFDLRCYCLITRHVDRLISYWYTQGYARTSSFKYDQNNKLNMMVHLTNEAVQVQSRYL